MERKGAACYCAGQIRRNKSPVPSPPVAPGGMQQSCSSMTCHKHEGKHTLSNTLQRGKSRFYCLWEFTQQQLMAFHLRFYWAIKWHVSSLPSYFLAFGCDCTGSICESVFPLLTDLHPPCTESLVWFQARTPKCIILNLSSYQCSSPALKQSCEKAHTHTHINTFWNLFIFFHK